MKKTATASFTIDSWEEQATTKPDDIPRITRATVKKTFSGDIAAEGYIEYVMMYRADGSASFVGMERVTGRIGKSEGSFVLQHIGTFRGGEVAAKWVVVDGSGTRELKGLKGEGGFVSGHAESYPILFEYELP